MDKTLEQLARYVHQQLQQGVSEQNIRAALAQNRWTPDWIDAVFNVVHQNPTMFSAPSIKPPAESRLHSPEVKPAMPPAKPVQRPVSTRTTKSKKGLFIVLATGLILLALAVAAYFMFLSKESKPEAANPKASTSKQEEQKPPKAPDEERKEDLNVILSDLADFYMANKNYPTYDSLKSKDFPDKYPEFDTKALADPEWKTDNKDCSDNGRAIVASNPTPSCYSYSATTSEGAVCDNAQTLCTRMTVTTVLESGTPYAVTLDRNTVVSN